MTEMKRLVSFIKIILIYFHNYYITEIRNQRETTGTPAGETTAAVILLFLNDGSQPGMIPAKETRIETMTELHNRKKGNTTTAKQPQGGGISRRIVDLMKHGSIHDMAITYVREYIDTTADEPTITKIEADIMATHARLHNRRLFDRYIIHYNAFLNYAFRVAAMKSELLANKRTAEATIIISEMTREWRQVRRKVNIDAAINCNGLNGMAEATKGNTVKDKRSVAASIKAIMKFYKASVEAIYLYANKFENTAFRPLEVMPSALKERIESTEQEYNKYPQFIKGNLDECTAEDEPTDDIKRLAVLPSFEKVRPPQATISLFFSVLERCVIDATKVWNSEQTINLYEEIE